MTKRLFTGAIQSANTPNSYPYGKDDAIYRCMVTNVIYVDDPKNITKNSDNPQVLYEVIILGGFKEGQLLDNVRVCSSLGGQYNYAETILRKTSFPDIHKTPLNKHDGDVVLVSFVQGNKSFPVIIGKSVSSLDKTNTGATKEQGQRSVTQYNGVNELIDKDGNYTLIRKGGQKHKEKDYFIPVDSEEYDKEFKHDSNNPKESFKSKLLLEKDKVVLQDNTSIIEFDKTNKKLTNKVGAIKDGELKANLSTQGGESLPFSYTEIIDGVNETKTKTYKTGMSVIEDGKKDSITITTKGGLSVKIDGTNDNVKILTAAGDDLDIKPGSIKVKENGGGTLNLASGKVALGNGEELLQLIDDLLTAIQATTHIGNLGVPTGVPINNADFAAIQTKLNSIKGSL